MHKNILQVYSDSTIDRNTEAHYALHSYIRTEDFPQIHDFYEFSLVLKGILYLEVNQNSFTMKKGSMLFIRPGDIHVKSQEAGTTHINLAFPQKLINDLFTYLGLEHMQKSMIKHLVSAPQVLSQENLALLLVQINKLNTIDVTNIPLKRSILRFTIAQIITSHYLPSLGTVPAEPYCAQGIPWFEQLLNKINKKENFIRGTESLSELTTKSQSYICRTFQKQLSCTPTEYYNQLRLNYAANMILYSDMELLDIIYETGFQSVSYFYKLFTEKYRTTPHAFKKQWNSNL